MRPTAVSCALGFVLAAGPLQAEAQPPPRERAPIASVGSQVIYLDEIEVPVKPEGMPSGAEGDAWVDYFEILSLRQRIRDVVINQEIAARAIVVRDDLVAQRARANMERLWLGLGSTDEERERKLESMRQSAGKISEALRLWKEDPERGDAFAARELEPLGISKSLWGQLKLQSDAPWLLKRLEEERTRDRRSFQEVPPSELVHARRMLALEELKRVVVRSVTVSRAETNRLLDLVERTEWVEIVAATGRRDRVVRLQSGLRTDAPTALREARLLAAPSLSSERLDRSGLWPPGPGAEPHNFAMFLAIHANATSAGTVSAVFEAASQDGRRTWLLYIAARQTRKRAPGSGEQTTGRARAAIEHVKRVQRFELWLWDRIRERTTILVPRYQESIEPHEAAPLYEGKTGSPLGTVRGR